MAANLDAGPSLEDILSRHGLERQHLERQCTRPIRITIATRLVDWKTTGHYFGIPAERLAAIDREHATEDQRRIALLDCWENREGSNASCLKLADVLHRRGRSDLVELLCTEVQRGNDGNQLHGLDIDGRIETLENQFQGLRRRFQSELSERRVSVNDVLAELTMLPIKCRMEYERSIQKMLPTLEESNRLSALFHRLNPLSTFIDYGLLQHLVSNLGSTKIKEDMTSYVDEVQEFMRETTVGDVIDHWPGDDESHANYSKLRAKFKDDPKTYTLERLNSFRRRFCSRVRLSEFIFGLISLEPSESFFVTWLIPTVVVPELSKSVCQIECGFYESEHILSLSVDQKQLYPPASASIVQAPALLRSLQQKPDWEKIVKSKHIKKWLERSKSLCILVTGRTGIGKSALVNGIVGKYVAKEDNTLDAETSKVMEYRTTIRGVEVIVYDSPGLQDGTSKEEEYLKDMEEKCKKVDLILYCTKMTEARISQGEHEAIRKLSRAFGINRFWSNTVFVLTFANEVRSPPRRSSSAPQTPFEEFFKQRLSEWQEKLHRILCDAGVEKEVAEKVPVVPAGYHIEPSLPAAGCEFWLSNLWFKCLDRTADAAKPAFLKINWNRLRTSEEVSKEDMSKKEAYEQPIVYNRGNVFVPPIILEFLGLKPEMTEAGKVGGDVGGTLGFWIGGGMGMDIGGMAGAILGELVYQYGMQFLQDMELMPHE